jgi:hypothetical protein
VSLSDALDAVGRYRERVRAQAQLARDIQHLQEVARMLFEDKPDKTKAVEAVNDIAAKRLARMDEGARQLLDSEPPIKNRNGSHDRGELIRWLMLVNRPGQFPYTQGIAEPGAPKSDAPHAASRARVTLGAPPDETTGTDPALYLAAALKDGWALLEAAKRDSATAGRLSRFADCHRIRRAQLRRQRAGSCRAATWAVSLREHFGVRGDSLKLKRYRAAARRCRPLRTEISDRATDQPRTRCWLPCSVWSRVRGLTKVVPAPVRSAVSGVATVGRMQPSRFSSALAGPLIRCCTFGEHPAQAGRQALRQDVGST